MPVLGCIADDFTGAADVANVLSRGGMDTVLLIGEPEPGSHVPPADAYVVALKSRTAPASEAVRASLRALAWLRGVGTGHIYFKYCSTFDSSDDGNIGPVADALLDALGEDFTVVCPAFPATGRTVYLGHLFVEGVPLAESPMARHPLTPMTDSNLIRVLGRQTTHAIANIPYTTVREGAESIRSAAETLRSRRTRYAVVDALDDDHLMHIAAASIDFPMLTGAAGLALHLPKLLSFSDRRPSLAMSDIPSIRGPAAVLVGSRSPASTRQVAAVLDQYPSITLDPIALAQDARHLAHVTAWATASIGVAPVLVHSGGSDDALLNVQQTLGREVAAQLLDSAFGTIAQALVAAGVRRLVVAGGETSGAVVSALGVRTLRVGNEIAPGVPWTYTTGADPIALALKSGNFGGWTFLADAWQVLDDARPAT